MSGPGLVDEPRITMADIAALAGVSEATVSRALAGSPLVSLRTRERIQELARAHAYEVNPLARSLRSKQTRTIAVGVPLSHSTGQHLTDPFFAEMLAHLADALTARGYDLLLCKVVPNGLGWVEAPVHGRRADGVIIIGQSLEHAALNHAAAKGTPLAVWGARLPDQHYVTVGSDNFAGGAVMTRHLLARGRTRIAFLGNEAAPEVAQRHAGYVAALAERGLDPDPRLDLAAPFTTEEAYAAVRRLIATGAAFDGVIAASDVIAMSAIRALAEAGRRVPDDVSVGGFDDIAMAAFTSPPLTTVRQNVAGGAAALVERVLSHVQGEPGQSLEMPPELVVRGST